MEIPRTVASGQAGLQMSSLELRLEIVATMTGENTMTINARAIKISYIFETPFKERSFLTISD
jgi:hypothetical protein